MTVTDEDRKATEVYLERRVNSVLRREPDKPLFYEPHALAEAFAAHRQAAYAAGLERAAVIAWEYGPDLLKSVGYNIATAIRAEKDKA